MHTLTYFLFLVPPRAWSFLHRMHTTGKKIKLDLWEFIVCIYKKHSDFRGEDRRSSAAAAAAATMEHPYRAEVTIVSARDLKNVNWRNGELKAYAVVWVDPSAKCSTKADLDGDTSPVWDEKFTIPLVGAVLHIDIVHDCSLTSDDHPHRKVEPLVGSALLSLSQVLDEAGVGGTCTRSLKLKRPSGLHRGNLDIKVRVLQMDPPRPPYGGAPPYAAAPPAWYPSPQGGNVAPPNHGHGWLITATELAKLFLDLLELPDLFQNQDQNQDEA